MDGKTELNVVAGWKAELTRGSAIGRGCESCKGRVTIQSTDQHQIHEGREEGQSPIRLEWRAREEGGMLGFARNGRPWRCCIYELPISPEHRAPFSFRSFTRRTMYKGVELDFQGRVERLMWPGYVDPESGRESTKTTAPRDRKQDLERAFYGLTNTIIPAIVDWDIRSFCFPGRLKLRYSISTNQPDRAISDLR